MKAVYKYTLTQAYHQRISMPGNARIIHVDVQHDMPCVWAEVELEVSPRDVELYIVQTGMPLPNGEIKYVGTFMLDGGYYVGHVYQLCQ